MKLRKITTADILALEKGEIAEWETESPRAARTVQSMCSYAKTFCDGKRKKGVKEYKTSRNGRTIKVQAL